jgi:hypothetical protein
MARFLSKLNTGAILCGAFLLSASGEQTNVAPALYQSVTPAIQLRHITPVEYFRGILGMTPAQREKALAEKSPAEKKAIFEKVREYEALPPAVREERLRQTDLHWHLMMLMRLEPKDRAERLKQISPLEMPMVMEQLDQWDALPVVTRKALLSNSQFLETYVEWQASSPVARQEILKKLPPDRRERFREEATQWESLPEDQRARLCGQFQQFFIMTRAEQRQTINTLSDTERGEMENALEAYSELPPAQRQRCVDSFEKFAVMSPEERAQFLQNAEKWEVMTVHERQLWRSLVGQLPPMPPMPSGYPPMPPGLPLSAPPFPPSAPPAPR